MNSGDYFIQVAGDDVLIILNEQFLDSFKRELCEVFSETPHRKHGCGMLFKNLAISRTNFEYLAKAG